MEGGSISRSGDRKGELLLGGQVKGKLNPAWVEQLMGLPAGWTVFTCSAMESYPPKQKEHGASCMGA
jgi:hypothetical protein